MQQRKLGVSGLLVSALGLGCMGMSEFYGQSDDDASLRTLARALFDTADTYGLGHNEELIGRFIAEGGQGGAIGLSEVSEDTLRRAHAMHPVVAAVQSEPEAGMLAACTELGNAFMAYSPLGRAFLTGTVNTSELADNDFRKHTPRFAGEAEVCNRRLVDALATFAQARGLASSEVAMAWLLNKPTSSRT